MNALPLILGIQDYFHHLEFDITVMRGFLDIIEIVYKTKIFPGRCYQMYSLKSTITILNISAYHYQPRLERHIRDANAEPHIIITQTHLLRTSLIHHG